LKTIVVGNASSSLSYKLGHLIDEFDEVVRFNEFRILGFEEFVGTKTTIWVRNSALDLLDKDEGQFKEVILQSVEFPNKYTDHSVYERYPKFDDEIIKEIRCHVDAPGLNLSTGIQALGHFSRNQKIWIHGFDSFAVQKLYFEKMDGLRHSKNEKNYIDFLKSEGRVVELSEIKFS
jgi:hypothetical protein